MPTSSVVITLARSFASSGPLLRHLRSRAELTIGRARGRYLPVVLDTATLGDAATMVEALARRDDVLRVDLVTVELA